MEGLSNILKDDSTPLLEKMVAHKPNGQEAGLDYCDLGFIVVMCKLQ